MDRWHFYLTYILVSAMGLLFFLFVNFVIPSSFPLIPSFLEILKFSKKTFQRKNKIEGNYSILKNISFLKINISKLINYSTDMYGSCQGIIVSKSW
jgi:hypothetical protein